MEASVPRIQQTIGENDLRGGSCHVNPTEPEFIWLWSWACGLDLDLPSVCCL